MAESLEVTLLPSQFMIHKLGHFIGLIVFLWETLKAIGYVHPLFTWQ